MFSARPREFSPPTGPVIFFTARVSPFYKFVSSFAGSYRTERQKRALFPGRDKRAFAGYKPLGLNAPLFLKIIPFCAPVQPP